MPVKLAPPMPGVPNVIDYIFQIELDRYLAGEVASVSVDARWKAVIGQQGIKEMIEKLSNFFESGVRTTTQGGRIYMDSTGEKIAVDDKEDKESDLAPVKHEKVPRPPNAFILYRQHHHSATKAKYPEYRNTKLSQVLGAQWKAEPLEIRQHFHDLARRLKEEHLKIFPGYSYQPRKSADKKRRMTAKKAAQVDALAQALVVRDVPSSTTFPPLEVEAKPTLEAEPFGNSAMMLNFVLGGPDISPEDFCAMIQANNEKVKALPTVESHRQNIAPIITASPALALDGDIGLFEKLPGWGAFDNAHQLDCGPLDEEFFSYWSDEYHPVKGIHTAPQQGFAGEAEVRRTVEVLGSEDFEDLYL